MLIYSHKISFTMIDEEFWCFHILNIRVHHFRNLAWSVSSVCGALYHNGRQDTWWTIHLLPEKFHFLAFGPSKYQSRGFLSPEESCSDYALWCYFITYHVYCCDIMLHTLLVLMLLIRDLYMTYAKAITLPFDYIVACQRGCDSSKQALYSLLNVEDAFWRNPHAIRAFNIPC